jgi:acetyltransferase-like isoleucine patch superfamily enzyme
MAPDAVVGTLHLLKYWINLSTKEKQSMSPRARRIFLTCFDMRASDAATHDYDNPAFPLLAFTMQLGTYAWVGARSVAPEINLGDGALLGLGSVATRDLEP